MASSKIPITLTIALLLNRTIKENLPTLLTIPTRETDVSSFELIIAYPIRHPVKFFTHCKGYHL